MYRIYTETQALAGQGWRPDWHRGHIWTIADLLKYHHTGRMIREN